MLAPAPFSSASFLGAWEVITAQAVTGLSPKPDLASDAHLLTVKCIEVTFPSGICFLTEPKEPVAHRTRLPSSSEAPCRSGASLES